MASGGSDLSTRMSEENKQTHESAFYCFKKMKFKISNIIKVAFPFLELLRDYGFINSETYENSKESFKTLDSKQEVIYYVLDEVEKTFNLSLLEALFSKDIMKKYPGLNHIYKVFKKEVPNIELFLESDGEENDERPDIQQSQVQGTAPPVNGLSEYHRETQEINANETGTTSDNNDALESQHRYEQCAQVSEPAVISSEDSTESSDGDKPPEASTSAMKRKPDTMNFGNNSTPEKAKRRRRKKQHTDGSVNFDAEMLPVTCGDMKGMLIKRKLERGGTVKCIRREDGTWFTPREFEEQGGYKKSCNWKISVCCNGRTLKWLMEHGHLPKPPGKAGKQTKLENAKKCKICQDDGKLFACSTCFSCFHGDCHLPLVEPQSTCWSCTFCTINPGSGSQQCYSESEVLAREMKPEEKLKCEFLLLKIYYHLESNFFPNIPHENYDEKASRCLEKLRTLDKIKKKLIEKSYSTVEKFVQDMDNICQDPRSYDLELREEEFKKSFKEVFAIQKTNQNSSLV